MEIETNPYAVYSTSTPPTAVPKIAPTGAPAAKVAKAIERAREGGKECARMPNCSQIDRINYQILVRSERCGTLKKTDIPRLGSWPLLLFLEFHGGHLMSVYLKMTRISTTR